MASRPSWSSDGGRLALTCAATEDEPGGLQVATLTDSDYTGEGWPRCGAGPSWGGDGRIYFALRTEDPAAAAEGDSSSVQIYSVSPDDDDGNVLPATNGLGHQSAPDVGEPGLLYVSAQHTPEPSAGRG